MTTLSAVFFTAKGLANFTVGFAPRVTGDGDRRERLGGGGRRRGDAGDTGRGGGEYEEEGGGAAHTNSFREWAGCAGYRRVPRTRIAGFSADSQVRRRPATAEGAQGPLPGPDTLRPWPARPTRL